jgi:uncharacterized repeat protein (TIGR03803 family)
MNPGRKEKIMKKSALFVLIGLFLLTLPILAQINLLHEFAGGTDNGAYPRGDLVLSGTTFYGMTWIGGDSNNGTIFKIEIDGSGLSLLHEFTGGADDGARPNGSLILSGTTLYGMTWLGGDHDMGTIFKIEINGSGFALLHEFAGGTDDGANPNGSLIISGSTLYGMTAGGGDSSLGTIFKMENNGSGFALLHEFAGNTTDGANPNGSLIISGSTLYGMTAGGGDRSMGTIFKIETDNSGYTLLHEFASSTTDGANPNGSLIISDSTLYGMTIEGGNNNNGTIFKIQTNGTDFNLIHSFAGGVADGAFPRGSLLLSGSTLYGMSQPDGAYSNIGTIFKLGISGTDFALLHSFVDGADDGASPFGSIIISGSTLYGMTPGGGDSGMGVIFSLPLYNISGTVTHDGSPMADVVMTGLPGNPVTDGSGYYSTMVASGWSGTVTPTRQYYNFTPSSTNYAGINSDQTTDYTATLSQSLVVTSPASGSVWQKGMTYNITWLKQGVQNANVKIALWKDTNTLVQMIATTTPNDGAYDWTVPTTLATGSNYFIRVRTLDNLISDYSDKFSIIVPSIIVTAPSLGTVWVKDTTKTITWNKVGTQDANVRIQLFRGTTKILDITPGTANSGAYDWAIPTTLANAGYTVRITTLDSKVKAISKSFTIARSTIRVTAPAAGALWQRGVVHTITWTGEGVLNANVRIQLVRGDQVSTIAATTANDGSFYWTIPANRLPAANYRIRVTTVDNLVSGQSDKFSITSL